MFMHLYNKSYQKNVLFYYFSGTGVAATPYYDDSDIENDTSESEGKIMMVKPS